MGGLADKQADRIAFFSVSGHIISGSASIVDHEKTFKDRGSDFNLDINFLIFDITFL